MKKESLVLTKKLKIIEKIRLKYNIKKDLYIEDKYLKNLYNTNNITLIELDTISYLKLYPDSRKKLSTLYDLDYKKIKILYKNIDNITFK